MITAEEAMEQAASTTEFYMLSGIRSIAKELDISEEAAVLEHSGLLQTFMTCCAKDYATAVEGGFIS
jgi:hypothetical protein|tara:strand:- start:302 stop:502 length:201 start_codon:yes stop_codon:yes gene_type:complete